jgi:hypothetical protein
MASLFLIVCVVLYEVFQPLLNFEKYNHLTKMEYYKRYNREEYEKVKPKTDSVTVPVSNLANDSARINLIAAEQPPVASALDEQQLR